MRLLVTGGAGFIGSNYVHHVLATTDDDVTVFDALTYLVDGYYDPADELGVAWDDPEVGADWGVADPVLSGRDHDNPRRAGLPEAQRPRWTG